MYQKLDIITRWGTAYGPGNLYVHSIDEGGLAELKKFETELSKVLPVITANTYQSALELVLQSLGAGEGLFPVIMPITAHLSTFSAVLRAGCLPILFDVTEPTYQMDPLFLEDALSDFEKGAVVILSRPFGRAIDPALLEVCKDTVTISENTFLPKAVVRPEGLLTDFSVYSLVDILGSGGAIYCKHLDQIQTLDKLRKSVLFQDSMINAIVAHVGHRRVPYLEAREELCNRVVNMYLDILDGDPHIRPVVEPGQVFRSFIVEMDNAIPICTSIAERQKLPIFPAVVPLYEFKEARERFNDGIIPEYPHAKTHAERLIALPVHPDMVPKDIENVISAIYAVM